MIKMRNSKWPALVIRCNCIITIGRLLLLNSRTEGTQATLLITDNDRSDTNAKKLESCKDLTAPRLKSQN